jgi:hypothetical protein
MKYDPDVFAKCPQCGETEIKTAYSQFTCFGGRYAGQVVYKCGHFHRVTAAESSDLLRMNEFKIS